MKGGPVFVKYILPPHTGKGILAFARMTALMKRGLVQIFPKASARYDFAGSSARKASGTGQDFPELRSVHTMTACPSAYFTPAAALPMIS